MANCHSIAVHLNLFKVLEKIVCKQTQDHLKLHKLLAANQHGFLKGRSTESALLGLTKLLLKEIINCRFLPSLDNTCAFNTINHKQLSNKLPQYGFDTGSTPGFFHICMAKLSLLSMHRSYHLL